MRSRLSKSSNSLPLFLAWITLISFFLTGCSGGADRGASEGSLPAASMDMSKAAGMGGEAMVATKAESMSEESLIKLPKKIIYTGDVRFATEDLAAASKSLEALIQKFGGYISNSNKSGNRGEVRTATWTFRLPSSKFQEFMSSVAGLGELESVSQNAEDVSEEFYDVQARLKNKRVEEERLLELLKKATGKLTEVLQVEKELTRVRDEIERIEGRLRYLANQTDLSTVTVAVREVKNFEPVGPPTLATKVKRSFVNSITSMKDTFTTIVLFLVAVLPWLLVFGMVFWLIRRITTRVQRPHPSVHPETPEREVNSNHSE